MHHLYHIFYIVLALAGHCGEAYLIGRARWSGSAGRVNAVSADVQSHDSALTSETIDQWWQRTDHLLTIGTAGLTPKHINSLKNLVQEHGWVKIKLASNKVDAKDVVDGVVRSENLAGLVKILAVRGRFFAVGSDRKVLS
jgi:RNA-binding protein YhbY